ncbi:MAG: CRISPR-associated protein Cas5 [Desulfurococcaceae archaeon]
MPLLRAFYSRVTLSWGFTVRHKGVSAAQPALILPSPTTIVGAFAYPLLRLLNVDMSFPERTDYEEFKLITPVLKHLLESTKIASASLQASGSKSTGLAVHQELGKLVTAPYRGGGSWNEAKKTKLFTEEFHRKGVTQAIAVQAVGATYGPGATLELLWIFDAEKLAKSLGVKIEGLDEAAKKAVHGVVRIGSKEGLVAVLNDDAVYEKKVDQIEAGVIKTRFYVEKGCVDPLEKHAVSEITMWNLTGKTALFYVPAYLGSSNVLIPLPEGYSPHFILLEPCKAYKLSNNVVGVGR